VIFTEVSIPHTQVISVSCTYVVSEFDQNLSVLSTTYCEQVFAGKWKTVKFPEYFPAREFPTSGIYCCDDYVLIMKSFVMSVEFPQCHVC
jgi:hypothetical protein